MSYGGTERSRAPRSTATSLVACRRPGIDVQRFTRSISTATRSLPATAPFDRETFGADRQTGGG
jgi:hypothetical protein